MCACGVPEASAAPRCRACPLVSVGAGAPAGVLGRQGVRLPPPVAPPSARYSRWAKSETSFGPFGRIAATIALLAILAVLLVTVVTGVGIVGAGIYGFVVLPLALKHVWKKIRLPD